MTNKLKELRTAKGLSQKDIAEQLRTTSQTVGRWENGDKIPAKKLPELAALLGCSADKLLGIAHHPRQAEPANRERVKAADPFGTLKAILKGGLIEYPIDGEERDRLQDQHFLRIVESSGWLEFETLNNKLIFLNPSYINALELISDHTEEMPYFASREAYQALVDDAGDTELPEPIQGEVAKTIKRLTTERDPEKARHAAIDELTRYKVIFGDGSQTSTFFSATAYTSIAIIEDGLDANEPNAFLTIDEDGPDLRVVNLSSVAVIEVPLLAYRAMVAKKMAEPDPTELAAQ